MQRDNIVGTLHTNERINGGLSPRERLMGYGSVGGGVSSYNELTDLPTMNGHTIEGGMTPADLDIWQPKDFSTSEQNTGLKWIDGKDIYYKTFNVTLNANTVTIPETTDTDKIILIFGFVDIQSENRVYHLPYADSDDFISFGVTTSGIQIYTSNWFKIRTPNARSTIFYTKN